MVANAPSLTHANRHRPGAADSLAAAHVFYPESYGAKGDAFLATDVTTNGTSTFTSATIAANAVVNQYVMINGGRGTSDTAAIGQITAINTGTNAVTISSPSLAINASASSLRAICGTDDTSAINSCFSADASYATSNDYFCEVQFQATTYVLATGPTQTNASPALINSQLPIPYPSNNNGRKLVFGIKGMGRSDHFDYWNSTIPDLAGTALVSMVTAPSTLDATYLVQSVLGSPSGTQGFNQGGTMGATFVNHKPVIENIQIIMPVYTHMTAFDLTYATGFYMDGCSVMAFAQPLAGGGPLLNTIWSDASVFGSRLGHGLRMPQGGNNADNYVGGFAVEGITVGVLIGEHAWMDELKSIYCAVAVKIENNTQGHGLVIGRCTAEAYQGGVLTQTTGLYPIFVGQWMTENSATAYDVSDSGGQLRGEFHWADVVDARGPVITGAGKLRIVNDVQGPGAWSGQPSVPASTTNQQNTAWRDAAVSVKGGTVTAVVVDGVTVSTVTNTTVFVPAGKNISITYSAAPTWAWTLL